MGWWIGNGNSSWSGRRIARPRRVFEESQARREDDDEICVWQPGDSDDETFYYDTNAAGTEGSKNESVWKKPIYIEWGGCPKVKDLMARGWWSKVTCSNHERG